MRRATPSLKPLFGAAESSESCNVSESKLRASYVLKGGSHLDLGLRNSWLSLILSLEAFDMRQPAVFVPDDAHGFGEPENAACLILISLIGALAIF